MQAIKTRFMALFIVKFINFITACFFVVVCYLETIFCFMRLKPQREQVVCFAIDGKYSFSLLDFYQFKLGELNWILDLASPFCRSHMCDRYSDA